MPWNKAIGPQAPDYYAPSKSDGEDPRHPAVSASSKKKSNDKSNDTSK